MTKNMRIFVSLIGLYLKILKLFILLLSGLVGNLNKACGIKRRTHGCFI